MHKLFNVQEKRGIRVATCESGFDTLVLTEKTPIGSLTSSVYSTDKRDAVFPGKDVVKYIYLFVFNIETVYVYSKVRSFSVLLIISFFQ